ncbi:MAG: hypothetical protein IJ318_00030 [Clostridia bacterium]|nr:hypothetical protein [Clostridia bacterium]
MKNKILLSILAFVLAFSCFAFTGCGKTPNQYSITLMASHYNLGSVEGVPSGRATYFEGDKVTIKATPATSNATNNNPEFICWLLNNKVVSTLAEYEFEVSAETAGDYVALFTCEYLEYFALNQLELNTAITDGSTATVIKFSLELGVIENLTQEVFSLEPTSSEQLITLSSTEIYPPDQNPFAYDMQEDIFVKFTLVYEQDGVQFESVTTTKITGVNDVTLESIGLTQTTLNLATNAENADLVINLDQNATLSLNFARLTTFQLVDTSEKE